MEAQYLGTIPKQRMAEEILGLSQKTQTCEKNYS
jgi:hypothetical protein